MREATPEAPRRAGPATDQVWVLADPRAGTAAQALGIAERLGLGFAIHPLAWGPLARLPWPLPTLAGLTAAARAGLGGPPWPRLVLSAGRRAAPVALWLGRRGARTVHCMRPGFGAAAFDLLVIGRHDGPPEAPNILPILGACHRLAPARLAVARAEWAALAALPAPRVALLVGGKPGRQGPMAPAAAAAIAARVAGFAGSVMASTSRRSGPAAAEAMAMALAGVPHRLYRAGEAGPNPYVGFLAWADAVVVTGDSVSMLSEALATLAPVFIADPGGLGSRHRRLAESLVAAGQARPLAAAPAPFARPALDETGRVAAAIAIRGLL
ncbi:nucleoside-diphosphate sugar epimerase [Siccirubricoccus deserti]|uniref:Mitochondrial fission ELM1 family protein n=1 Tax=Siccirubricoccus deserti TaxID=2013562 RepID=A0A9X0UCQ5_9PROT|nr:ELM1/GtrOC1 family putative glycosyltransferase [Siccirubricoccus deserti]MBC4014668.1 mitochondrial fission ELM1 family protein [Siccirubricoccus deserti]GGC34087.1 nucleoside-diphosphate sugar epimerase [Siccirubricoccus deserti]